MQSRRYLSEVIEAGVGIFGMDSFNNVSAWLKVWPLLQPGTEVQAQHVCLLHNLRQPGSLAHRQNAAAGQPRLLRLDMHSPLMPWHQCTSRLRSLLHLPLKGVDMGEVDWAVAHGDADIRTHSLVN